MSPTSGASRHWVTPEASVPLRLLPIWEQVMHEHPVLDYMLRTGDTSARTISDIVPSTAFRRSKFYNEWYRRIGVEHALNTSVDTSRAEGLVVGVGLHRRTPDFSERDRTMLNLLRPHLAQAYHNALVVAGLMSVLDQRREGVIVLGRNAQTLVATPTAVTWLREYFARDGHNEGRLPGPLHDWTFRQLREFGSKNRLPGPQEPLVIDVARGRLIVRLVETAGGPVLHLTEERHSIPRETLEAWRLTGREAEVLAWLVEGKTNAEIARILGARPRTVEKHCERIFQKLGVENRTAAVRRALDGRSGVFQPMRPTHAVSR
ncbi:MAG: helix-turn-helix transcriptional regulator [Acidobacteria bacterium]|nr:helix-turn-helix transcriptional regulator [Acidobacteriota bacterium]